VADGGDSLDEGMTRGEYWAEREATPDERRRVESYGLNLSVSVDHFRHHVAGGRFPTLGGAGSELAVAIRDELEYAIGFLVAARSVFSKL
jgi:hypothetical protein